MSHPLHVAFLWHMHQPRYLDPAAGRLVMPWVRLHGVKAYADMAAAAAAAGVPVTFNLVPSLLRQIEAYGRGISDDFLEVSRRPAEDLRPAERAFVLAHFFSCHWPTMVDPYPRYRELLERRGREFDPARADDVVAAFSAQDLRDLQVWFNLAWVGFAGRKAPLVQELLAKGRLFTEEEKAALLDLHLETLAGLIPAYRALQEEGRVELSTSPFFHPILPLLVDTDTGRRPRPEIALPRRFQHPEDALEQLVRARRCFEECFGAPPRGLWPSEGAVSPEIIPLVQEAGFGWAASDEGILFRSLGDGAGPLDLFRPYRAEWEGASVDMVFRHHELSDAIGFVYQKTDPAVAVADFTGRLREIRERCREMDEPPLVAVILDGENPWEYYPDGGEAFLSGLYRALEADPDLVPVTVGGYLEAHPPERSIAHLYSGSWINSDFGIWIGGEEENRAWSLLSETRAALDRALAAGEVGEADREAALEAVLAAEGSDWFWWFGDQFVTDYAYEFDRLFRHYLQEVFRRIGRPVPAAVQVPVRRPRPVLPAEEPKGFLHPVVDGRRTHYWEWKGAGSLALGDLGGAMHRGEAPVRRILYGFDLERFYVRLDPTDTDFRDWEPGLSLRLSWRGEAEAALHIRPGPEGGWSAEARLDDAGVDLSVAGIRWAVGEIVEVALPFALLGAAKNERLSFRVDLLRDGLVLDRWPREGPLVVTVPDEDFERRIWLV
ncbi:hypothetical protein G3N55_04800 [Dissulfurirhabdus thermomarina]|uniref:Glycoside hydrolase family 57 N-terminal domain-containing protein n=1 Tax=Dissulfurirhabdus thermomarina TaxID=1765737 RepID=A0A6N9TR01_DISTH|nr:glycoside hydrolase family 57 protein [Dissulfurirhabdus thermomarina]NDY42164.1 hypothetical protein [Dissulfurirhabdus thermomarina]NMX22406.1 hypothetical protein [Dissulfurirhabdus thermomarina]